MKIEIHDSKNIYTIDLFDEYDTSLNLSSMSRTTGYTCTACANMLLDNFFNEKGIVPLEIIGKNKISYDYIINYLKDRKVNLKTNKKEKNETIN